MDVYYFLFWLFSAVAVFAALRVITVRNPVHAVLFLVLTFFTCAALWMLLEAEFLAIVLVLVYVGAVMVLFLFVVMMLDINVAPVREGFIQYLPLAATVAVIVVVEMVLVVGTRAFEPNTLTAPKRAAAGTSNTEALGELLYTEYLYHFEIAAAILLVAIIAAIALTMRKRPQTKYQNPAQQVRVTKQERLKVIKMESEK